VTVLELPGPLDPHVHLRDGDWAHKGTVATETAAALAGGYWAVVDMPNAPPEPTDPERLRARLSLLRAGARCDVATFLGAGPGDWPDGFAADPAADVVGLKLYLGATTGRLLVDAPAEQERLVRAWRAATDRPVALHAEGAALERALDLARRRSLEVHVCHVSTADSVGLIRRAKADGAPVSVGVTPHHLYLTVHDEATLGPRARVRPALGTSVDRDALWHALADGIIDLVESDHAPHTLAEKASLDPPSGVPGLETTLPLLGLAVAEGRLTIERLIELVCVAPQRRFRLAPPRRTVTRLDVGEAWVLEDAALLTSPGWTPFAGMRVRGRVREVRIGGRLVFDGERVLAAPGQGRVIQPSGVSEARHGQGRDARSSEGRALRDVPLPEGVLG
jgi:carbamoyl-phosphate synthase/aspartate carbamoyltransferase/dihydroorotase